MYGTRGAHRGCCCCWARACMCVHAWLKLVAGADRGRRSRMGSYGVVEIAAADACEH